MDRRSREDGIDRIRAVDDCAVASHACDIDVGASKRRIADNLEINSSPHEPVVCGVISGIQKNAAAIVLPPGFPARQ